MLKTILNSKELKRLLVSISNESRIPFKYLCEEVGIDYNEFMMSYINVKGLSTADISEDKFKELLKLLGISIRTQFVVDTKIDLESLKSKLAVKYDIKKKVNEKKGNT